MGDNKKALGENEFLLYHQGIVQALKEKAFRTEVKPHVGEDAPTDERVSIWFDTADASSIQEVSVMSVSEDDPEELTFNEEENSEELIFNDEEELTFNEEEEELTFNEEEDSEELTFNEEE